MTLKESGNARPHLAEVCSAESDCPIPTTHRRLETAHVAWHRCLENYQEPDAFVSDLNSTLQALRNVTWSLQKEMDKIEGFKEWYEGAWQPAMKANSFLRWAVKSRNTVVKADDLKTESRTRARVVFGYPDVARLIASDLADVPGLNQVEVETSTLSTLSEIMEGVPPTVSSNSVVVIERRWVESENPGTELLSVLAHVYSFLACLTADADAQFGKGPINDRFDPALFIEPDSPLPARALPPCMLTTHADRSTQLRQDGSIAGGRSWTASKPSAGSRQATVDAYGLDSQAMSDIMSGARTPLDFVDMFVHVATGILKSGQEHGWYMFFYRGPTSIHIEVLAAEDKADKWMLAQRMANIVRSTKADGVLEIGETWLAPAPKNEHDMVLPGDHPDRKEAITIHAELATGESRSVLIFFRRNESGDVQIENPVRIDSISNFLDAIREVWRAR